jgi:hypothetical protein
VLVLASVSVPLVLVVPIRIPIKFQAVNLICEIRGDSYTPFPYPDHVPLVCYFQYLQEYFYILISVVSWAIHSAFLCSRIVGAFPADIANKNSFQFCR